MATDRLVRLDDVLQALRDTYDEFQWDTAQLFVEAAVAALVALPEAPLQGLATCSHCDYHEIYDIPAGQAATWERLTAHVVAQHPRTPPPVIPPTLIEDLRLFAFGASQHGTPWANGCANVLRQAAECLKGLDG